MGQRPNIPNIQQKLLRWYRKNARPLPWRQMSDPYKIWVSEAMLQQTQVNTVIPYYFAFLKRFPTISSLAAAPLQDVLKAWEGLGYYSRARNLQKGAQHVYVNYLGRLPSHPEDLQKIPGIGPYMASAIASFAFGVRAPLLDVNGKRIVSRIFGKDFPEEILRTLAYQLLPTKHSSDFNQAIMELGQTFCLPKNPRCTPCPVQKECAAHQKGIQNEIPSRKTKPERPTRRNFALLAWKGNRFLIERRKEDGLLGGLWQLPLTTHRPKSGKVLGIVRHSYTHFHEVIEIFEFQNGGGSLSKNEIKWIRPKEIVKFPFTGVTHKAFRALNGILFQPSSGSHRAD